MFRLPLLMKQFDSLNFLFAGETMSVVRSCRTILLWLIPVGLIGCGASTTSDTPMLAEVKGVLLQGGKPVEGAEIYFRPQSDAESSMSHATTDAEGKFTLKYGADASGAYVGSHQVTVTVYGKRAEPEVEGQPGLPLEPPREIRLGQMEVPAEGLPDLKLEVPPRG